MEVCQKETLEQLEVHVRYARKAADAGFTDSAERLRDVAVELLELFVVGLRTGGESMYGKARVKVPAELTDRLVKTFGSSETAEEWYNRPNGVLHGETPAELVYRQGMGWLLDATCNWGNAAMEVIPE